MLTSLESYRHLAHNAAYAHRVKDVALATDMFAVLWRNLTAETEADHTLARNAFNAAFKTAYHLKWEPGLSPASAPALAHAVGVNAVKSAVAPALSPRVTGDTNRDTRCRNTADAYAPRKSAPRKSVALDCAAFYAKQAT